MAKYAPIEAKVTAGTWTTLVAGLITTWLVTTIPGLSTSSGLLQGIIVAAITAAANFIVSWLTKHTQRPGDGPFPSAPDGM